MTAIVFLSIGLSFVLGIRGVFFVAMTLVAFAVAAVPFANGHYRAAVAYVFGIQIAYVMGLLINAMRR